MPPAALGGTNPSLGNIDQQLIDDRGDDRAVGGTGSTGGAAARFAALCAGLMTQSIDLA
ncbi:MAG: hypothetical protein R2706_08855 [Acidimicrobiales bacterium]